MKLIKIDSVSLPPTAVIELTKGELLLYKSVLEYASPPVDYPERGAYDLGVAQIEEILVEFEYLEKST